MLSVVFQSSKEEDKSLIKVRRPFPALSLPDSPGAPCAHLTPLPRSLAQHAALFWWLFLLSEQGDTLNVSSSLASLIWSASSTLGLQGAVTLHGHMGHSYHLIYVCVKSIPVSPPNFTSSGMEAMHTQLTTESSAQSNAWHSGSWPYEHVGRALRTQTRPDSGHEVLQR